MVRYQAYVVFEAIPGCALGVYENWDEARRATEGWSEDPQGFRTVEEAHHVWTGGSPQNPTRFYIVPTISGVVHTVYYRAKLAAGGRGKEKYILKFRTRQEAEENLESLGIQPIREGEEVVEQEAPIEHSFQQPPSLQGAVERVSGEEFENDHDAPVDRAAVSYLANAMTERFSLLVITIQDHETISRMSEFPDDTPEVVLPAVDRYNDPQNVIENMPQQLP